MQGTITRAISIYESMFADPITIQILFRYANTEANGKTPLDASDLALSESDSYGVQWSTCINSLKPDAHTSNDKTANASLPANALPGYSSIIQTRAGARAVGLAAPPNVSANGVIGGSPPYYDAVLTLNSSKPFQFYRPPYHRLTTRSVPLSMKLTR